MEAQKTFSDDPFEALWWLYSISKGELAAMAGRTGNKSTLTYFYEAIFAAIDSSNNSTQFLKMLEKGLGFHFKRDYPDALPDDKALETLFAELKRKGVLPFMPKMMGRDAKNKGEKQDGQEAAG